MKSYEENEQARWRRVTAPRPRQSMSASAFSIPAVKEGVAAYVASVRLARLIGAAAAK